MYQSVFICLVVYLWAPLSVGAQQVSADPAIGPARFTQSGSNPLAGSFPSNSSYEVLISVKNNAGTQAIPANGFAVVLQLGRGVKFNGSLPSISANYSWSIDTILDPAQAIIRGVLNTTVSSTYAEDIRVPVRSVDGCITNNFLLSGINVNAAVIVNGNDFLNDDAMFQYAVFTPATAGCIGGIVEFGAEISGTAYQWQENNGAGFMDIANNANYSGATSNTLVIQNVPGGYSGNQYRCLVQTSSGIITTAVQKLRFQNRWNGLQNSDWHNAGNWSCCQVPDQYTDVVIPLSSTNQPQINNNVSIKSVTTMPGSVVTVKSAAVLEVKGLE